ncbi:MAG: cytochrome c oxidase subunit 3 family protein [Bdellovibrionales bacterium]|jgi:cytochrome c oxidase subunit III|nr:cytochrome c oxidase subunit 3 family protein [Bdellovibrionales bacterium]MBT3527005.1 cytochrome c oxidase subunit 3 family protein [Bdellovibrionales bacterium]MBT7766330.1 cytochrome c oxidase subunit 3 family protein [Bdellovibrionales bacterium]
MSSQTTSGAVTEHSEHYDEVGTRLGFWLFLFTELFLFGAFFIVYLVYRTTYLPDFQTASNQLSTVIGTTNTIILLFSSLTVVLAIHYMRKGIKKMALTFLSITILCGLAFLVIKSFEWGGKFDHNLFLQLRGNIEQGLGSPLLTPGSSEMLPMGQVLFFGLYFIMTGTHALHIIIGLIWMSVLWVWIYQGKLKTDRAGILENGGLYWHLVDLIWIYLFPLFYLIA